MEKAVKRPKKLSAEAWRRKRDQTRVCLGLALTRWRELKEATACKTAAELAFLLLDWSVANTS